MFLKDGHDGVGCIGCCTAKKTGLRKFAYQVEALMLH